MSDVSDSLILDEIVERFQSDWQSENPPKIADYLPGEEPLRSYVLAALVLTDLELTIRTRSGTDSELSGSLAAEYLRLHPSLKLSRVLVLELFAKEYRFRQRQEPKFTWNEFLQQVPDEYQEDVIPSLRFILMERKDDDEGAFGEVWLSVDQQLGREVALKVLKPGRLGEDERKRFIDEAKLTSRLEHPNIVPVYGIEETADGRPSYAMRFIEWPTLTRRISEHHSNEKDSFGDESFRRLITQFRDVCQAVAYAHEHCFLHLDIKPDNIQVGDFGETMLLDWGLARMSDEERTANIEASDSKSDQSRNVAPMKSLRMATGDVMGTPVYMSPEQAVIGLQSGGGKLNAACDIYGLGATLYQILTNQRPYETQGVLAKSSASEIFEIISTNEISAPRLGNSKIPKSIEAICLKAMARDPEDRYSSAVQLAQDLDSWLADEPVVAYADPMLERIRRGVKKHFTLATSAAVAVVVVMAMLFLTNSQLSEANTKAKQSEDAALDSLAKLKVANTRSKANEKHATESLVLLVESVSEDLRDVPEAANVRRDLLTKATEQIEKISVPHDENREFTRSSMTLLITKGNLILDFADGSDQKREEAYQYFLKAHEIAEQLAIDPGGVQAELDLLRSHNRIGDYLRRNRGDEALEYLNTAEQLGAKLATEHPNNEKVILSHASVLRRLADTYWRYQKDNQTSLAYSMKALQFLEPHAKSKPENGDLQAALADAYMSVGDSFRESRQTDDAIANYLAAMKIETKRLEGKNDFTSLFDLAFVYTRLGDGYSQGKQAVQAIEVYENALDICERLEMRSPQHLRNLNQLHFIHRKIGDVRKYIQKDHQKALGSYLKALEYCECILNESPEDHYYQMSLVNCLERVGETELVLDGFNPIDARIYLVRRMDMIKEMVASDESDKKYLRNVGGAHESIGALEMVTGDHAAAIEHFEEMLKIRIELLDQRQINREFQLDLRTGFAIYFAAKHFAEESNKGLTASERFHWPTRLQSPPDSPKLEELRQQDWYEGMRTSAIAAKGVPIAPDNELIDAKQRNEFVEKYLQSAVEALQHGVDEEGFSDFSLIDNDPLLDDLRELPGFQAIRDRYEN